MSLNIFLNNKQLQEAINSGQEFNQPTPKKLRIPEPHEIVSGEMSYIIEQSDNKKIWIGESFIFGVKRELSTIILEYGHSVFNSLTTDFQPLNKQIIVKAIQVTPSLIDIIKNNPSLNPIIIDLYFIPNGEQSIEAGDFLVSYNNNGEIEYSHAKKHFFELTYAPYTAPQPEENLQPIDQCQTLSLANSSTDGRHEETERERAVLNSFLPKQHAYKPGM